MSDVVRRLHGSWGEPERTMMQEAAAEIERLQASLPPAERYWEARWRDEKAECDRLKALNASFSAQIIGEQREIDRLCGLVKQAVEHLEFLGYPVEAREVRRKLADRRA